MTGIFGYFFGASGEIVADIGTPERQEHKRKAGLPDSARRRKGRSGRAPPGLADGFAIGNASFRFIAEANMIGGRFTG
ncbi:hypothetical protein [Mesorhizobium sp. J8]|uniref:hypothetical protein n=1 Tax=Mesorhizobium sp. J8 TaxID=2777475 RepID=UPI001915A899|nr:hypothetical protein [Mesorhizobium sp. J8]